MSDQRKQSIRISRHDLREIASRMKALPNAHDADITTKRAAIEALSSEIKSMRDKGYTIAQIADWLKANTPLVVSVPTIRATIAGKTTRKRKSRTTSGSTGNPQSTIMSHVPGKRSGMAADHAGNRIRDKSDPPRTAVEPNPGKPGGQKSAGTFDLGNDDV
ncbi:hypothetical protein [Acidiphilium sp.]|uniref:hypothetical protein n=1 Tax=Acidiphilium sp. TaxID=527 RepID=UPI000BDA210A|nr:hypothetical protein [Acidiphilium sp.]OYV67543.1 MAG: hypothetical protein B7X09_01125 [Acidiphilium sp. 21-66-27]HQT62624.1 hypothetical protein [Acidiphilium sp.]